MVQLTLYARVLAGELAQWEKLRILVRMPDVYLLARRGMLLSSNRKGGVSNASEIHQA